MGLDGIENKINPPEVIEKNIFEMDLAERQKNGIKSMPGSLGSIVGSPFSSCLKGCTITRKHHTTR